MARIRSIKPEFWTSAQILECSTNARLMFIGLWNFADDSGRHPDSPKQVKAEIFPADDFSNEQVSGWLDELKTNLLIVPYRFENKDYFYISGWKHQRIDKPQPPKYPEPFLDRSSTIPRTIPPDTIGYDRKGNDKIDDAERSALAPKGGSISQEAIDLADRITTRVGFSVSDPPPSWCGSAFKVQSWLSGGWPADAIFASIDKQMVGRNGQSPPNTIKYFENGIADFIAVQNAPLPKGTVNGYRGSRPLQDDSLSASRAAGRLAERAERGEFTFEPVPSLLPKTSTDIVRLLPKR